MNTSQLKKFAQSARLKLIEQVAAKLNYVLTHDTAELRGKAAVVNKLKAENSKVGQTALVEKVAYIWFNRLIALRFMDVNGYQPLGVSIISPSAQTNSVSPQILEEVHSGNFPSELTIDKAEILNILDGVIASNNPDNDVYRKLLVASCNHLNTSLPFLFARIDDYSELLLPDDLTSAFSVIKDVVNGMSEEDCAEVEIIGWLYQFYISEKKDEVFASKSAVKKEDIPAATQLFTPRWIVEYMVQNTVGKLWLQNKPNSKLKDFMPYFIDSPSLHSEDYLKVSSVEEIKLLDQACGSGHILVYGFDLLYKIYEEEGYNPNEIPSLIIKNNLFGFEIDERAAQLAGFAILMKGRSYYRRFFRNPIEPNILRYEDLLLSAEEIKEAFAQIGFKLSEELNHDLLTMQQATNYGSLIIPHTHISELTKISTLLQTKKSAADAFLQYSIEQISTAVNQLLLLQQKYPCVVDNPPYMGGGNMNKTLGDYVKTNYPDSKADLMACFMEAGLNTLLPKGFLGMINQHSWMFLSSYEKLRVKIIDNIFFDTKLHLGARTFPEIGGEVVQNTAFTFCKTPLEAKGSFIRLVDFNSSEEKRSKAVEAIQNSDCVWFYTADQKDFEKIPGSPIGYWINKNVFNIFENEKSLVELSEARPGLSSTNNIRFLRFWYENKFSEIGFNFKNRKDASLSKLKWFPFNKGGDFLKWYGNLELVVNWKNDGEDIKEVTKGASGGRIVSPEFYFKESISASAISSSVNSFRYYPHGGIFDVNFRSFFDLKESDSLTLIGYLNTKVVWYFLKILSPTLAMNKKDLERLPFIDSDCNKIQSIVKNNIDISILNWNSRESSWDFNKNGLINIKAQDLEETYDLFQQYWKNKFFQLHKNEEELNYQFIEIYGLQDELTPDVPLEEITIIKEETSIENGELVFQADEVFSQFVSYAVGCMFGRYSLDKEGLILASQGESLQEFIVKIGKEKESLSFLPDEDNIIPILDDEWFEDDIVARFHEFLKASFGDKEFQKNLVFVEECLGKDIRKYFVKDFYNDHIKRYKKRPIYWLFSSPKGSFNVLIYLHRYTPDTLNKILNSYLREFIEKLNLQRKQLEHIEVNGTPSEQSKARKEIDKIDIKLADCKHYEVEILYPLAADRIALDLDDGVLVNYNKLGKAVAEVTGLNDKATKKKVKEFDWIDTSLIR
jgi:type II restriction/modification system DNA methylase subunit YeeA